MRGWWDGIAAAALAALAAVACAGSAIAASQPPAQAASAMPCGGETIAKASIARVIDGRTVVLADGREVRLAALEVPQLLAADAAPTPGGLSAQQALAAFVATTPVTLRAADVEADRYGRLVAYLFAQRDGAQFLAQMQLISAGWARVGDHVDSRACAMELLRREAAARAAKLGLWADPYYEILHADRPADVLARRGRFALVEGNVASVHESGPIIYVNFGRHWSEDFTVTIRKRNASKFVAAGLDVKGLAGRRVRVRGWIERRGAGGSPWVEAVYPEQIEPADAK